MLAGSRVSPPLLVGGWMTTCMGRSYLRANSKSRWSWAGTAMTRAGAVAHEHEVGHVDGHVPARERVHAVRAGEHTLLFQVLGPALDAVHVGHLAAEGADFVRFFVAGDELFHHGVLGGQAHEGGPAQRVRPRGEHVDGQAGALDLEGQLRAHALADPVLLHGDDAFGPAALKELQVVQQLIRVRGDLEEPLLQLLLLHLAVAAPALAFLHLLVGQHGVAVVAPVHGRVLAVGQAALQHLGEEALLPLVVLRAGRWRFRGASRRNSPGA